MVQIQKHRTVLSSASSFFKQHITINQNNNNNVLYLKGIHRQELEAMLEFIYVGEAKIDEERIHKFIDAMKDLSLKEFCTIENEINFGFKEHDVKDVRINQTFSKCSKYLKSCAVFSTGLDIDFREHGFVQGFYNFENPYQSLSM